LPILVQRPRSLQNAALLCQASLPPGFAKLKVRLLAKGETKRFLSSILRNI
jgi:hypothetical protein